ncbi:ATP-binding protein [Nocardia sp. CDC159]|uniref:ATP-binding protein n=1 Tax=Nocardia pulmonis TaxID=2951408 RepID=A0A9X2E7Q0_9NOCA|nr:MULTISPECIES: ATP-binding protein [Nocardia]MCM6773038.1 ATP-binding protein [Nocardia pulmonis]MCM6785659.1 ATP-binding protein [Nocardia sp. CDC159]
MRQGFADDDGSARVQFARRLTALHRAAGAPSLRNVAMLAQRHGETDQRVAAATAQRISDWMSGRNVPARFESLVPVLQVLGSRARRRAGSASDAVNLRSWRNLWQAARSAPVVRPHSADPPYPDASGYGAEHASVLFGRRRALAGLLELVRASADSAGPADPVVLTGASGVGKTALLHAGVVPTLRAEPGRWAIAAMTPGRDPIGTLTRIFCGSADSATMEPDAVRRWAGKRRPLLIVDQLEQLYRPDLAPAERESFLFGLRRLAEAGTVLVAVRPDRLQACAEFPWLSNALRHNSFTLTPMGRQDLVSAIVGPPRSCGVSVDPGVVELLLAALEGDRTATLPPTADAGTLSVLSAAMRSMWPHRGGARLDATAYRRVGGVAGVVGHLAERCWEGLTEEERIDLGQVLPALVTVHRDGTLVRRRMPVGDLGRIATRSGPGLVERLIRARLITVDSRHAHLIHDALLDWERLRGWIAANRTQLIWRQRIEDDAAEWEAAGRDPELLYRGVRLTTAIHHADPSLSLLATRFLRACARAELGGAPDRPCGAVEFQNASAS